MFRRMTVMGVALDPVANTPIVILKDAEGEEILPIWIGFAEAHAIAAELEKVRFPRPMTHDLLRNILQGLEARVERVEVVDLRDNTFYALIHLQLDRQRLAIDARPSDAIALALRTESPIYVSEEVLRKSRREEEPDWDWILEHMEREDFGGEA